MRTSNLARAVAGIALVGALTACSGGGEPTETVTPPPVTFSTSPAESAADILASTAWETTGAKDADGKSVPLTDAKVKSFVGYAYFDADGTFTMFNLDDSPKMQGDWSMSADGKKRTIVARDASGKVMFTRDVDIVKLTDKEFTYRVYPDEADKKVYYDIVHTPTDHEAPETSGTATPTPSATSSASASATP